MPKPHLQLLMPFMLILSTVAWSQTPTPVCAPLVPLEGSSQQYRQRGDRCEGLYEAFVGAQLIEIVSFTSGPVIYTLASDTVLSVDTQVPLNSRQAHIRAVARSPLTFYQMDAILTPERPLSWPAADVLLPQNLNPARIGIFGWIDDNPDQIFLPVRTSVGVLSENAESPQSILTVRPSFDVSNFVWRHSDLKENGACSRFGDWIELPSPSIIAWQTIDIDLSFLSGSRCIEIAAQNSNTSQWVTRPSKVELPSQ